MRGVYEEEDEETDEEVQLRDCPLRGSEVRLLDSEVEDEIRDQSGGHR